MAETDGSQCVVNLNGNGAASYQRSEVQQTKDAVDKSLVVDEIGKAFKKVIKCLRKSTQLTTSSSVSV